MDAATCTDLTRVRVRVLAIACSAAPYLLTVQGDRHGWQIMDLLELRFATLPDLPTCASRYELVEATYYYCM